MEFQIGTKFVLENKMDVRRELRGQRCIVIETHPLFYKVRMETGEYIDRIIKLRKRTFNYNYKLYIRNKGGWIF